MNVNPTPKQQFLTTPSNITAHRALIELPAFEFGCNVALLEFQQRLSLNADAADAKARFWQMAGAVEFLRILRAMGEPPVKRDVSPIENLNHKV